MARRGRPWILPSQTVSLVFLPHSHPTLKPPITVSRQVNTTPHFFPPFTINIQYCERCGLVKEAAIQRGQLIIVKVSIVEGTAVDTGKHNWCDVTSFINSLIATLLTIAHTASCLLFLVQFTSHKPRPPSPSPYQHTAL